MGYAAYAWGTEDGDRLEIPNKDVISVNQSRPVAVHLCLLCQNWKYPFTSFQYTKG